jgi:hypothetical protein
VLVAFRDVNSGTGTRLDGSDTRMIFYSWVALVPDLNRDEYGVDIFFHPTGTRYFSTAMILGCEQVKMRSFCYINYNLF